MRGAAAAAVVAASALLQLLLGYIASALATVATAAVLLAAAPKLSRMIESKWYRVEARVGAPPLAREHIHEAAALASMVSLTASLLRASSPLVAPLTALLYLPLYPARLKLWAAVTRRCVELEYPLVVVALYASAEAGVPLEEALESLRSPATRCTWRLVESAKSAAEATGASPLDVLASRLKYVSSRLHTLLSAALAEYRRLGSYSSTVGAVYAEVRGEAEALAREAPLVAAGATELPLELQLLLIAVVGTVYIFYPASMKEMLLVMLVTPAAVAALIAAAMQASLPPPLRLRLNFSARAVAVATLVVAALLPLVAPPRSFEAAAWAAAAASTPSLLVLPSLAAAASGRLQSLFKEATRGVYEAVALGRSAAGHLARMRRIAASSPSILEAHVYSLTRFLLARGRIPHRGIGVALEYYSITSSAARDAVRQAARSPAYAAAVILSLLLFHATAYMVQVAVSSARGPAVSLVMNLAFYKATVAVESLTWLVAYLAAASVLGPVYALPVLLASALMGGLAAHYTPLVDEFLLAWLGWSPH